VPRVPQGARNQSVTVFCICNGILSV
jgi:hypothetical protein